MSASSATALAALEQRLRNLDVPRRRGRPAPNVSRVLGIVGEIELVRPRDSEQIAPILRTCADEGVTLTVFGGGSALGFGGPCATPMAMLSLERVPATFDHSRADFVVTASAGMRVAELQNRLRSAGQWLPMEIADSDVATLGGALGAAAPSLLGLGLGTLRAHALGLTTAHSDGRVTRAGGRVVKNVSGYDLMKLQHGAAGALGVVTELTLRTRPLPAADVELSATVDGVGSASAASRAIRSLPFEVGALWWVECESSIRVMVRMLGAGSALKAQVEQVRAAAAPAIEERKWQLCWRKPGDDPAVGSATVLESLGRSSDDAVLQCAVHSRPSRAPDLWSCLDELARTVGVESWRKRAVDLATGTAWVRGSLSPDNAPPSDRQAEGIDRALAPCGGRLVVHAAPRSWRTWRSPAPEPARLALQQRVKDALDPANVLSPGRFGTRSP